MPVPAIVVTLRKVLLVSCWLGISRLQHLTSLSDGFRDTWISSTVAESCHLTIDYFFRWILVSHKKCEWGYNMSRLAVPEF